MFDRSLSLAVVGLLASLGACATPPSSTPAISLVAAFAEADVSGSPGIEREFPTLEWRFDGAATIDPLEDSGPTLGWAALDGVEGLQLRDGLLRGRAGKIALLTVAIPEDALPADLLYEAQVRMRVTAGTKLGLETFRDEELDRDEILKDVKDSPYSSLMKDLEAGDEMRTYSMTEADATFNTSIALGSLKHLMLRIDGGEGSEFALESVRLITRTEHLAGVSSGVGWHGLEGGIFRETVVARTPETVTWEIDLESRPWLDVAIGTPEVHPITFRIEVEGGDLDPLVLRRTVTSGDRWEELAIDLARFEGSRVRLAFSLEGEHEARVGFWGTPAVRHRGARSTKPGETTPARALLADQDRPRGVILIVADTQRSDHLDAWGYTRETSPTLTRLAAGGTRFADTISQGSWTKVAIPAILTSLYATSHGISDIPHRLPASVTTLAEVFREAGYTTFHASSVIFSGRNSNLHQGIEVLHERSSVKGLDSHRSKTARTYVDRLLPWLETHRDQPFFVFLHVFDPHSPFRPFSPYDQRWIADDAFAEHEENVEKVEEAVDVFHKLPTTDKLRELGLDNEAFTAAEHSWYDGSILAMDHEIGRLLERLEELGLRDDTLIAFIADHGEEFREHGNPWHGHSVYGDMINVPLIVNWPGVVPAGLVVEQTTQSIDLMPTLLELALLPIPEQAQGRSLVPLMADPENPEELGWYDGPVFSERLQIPGESIEGSPDAYTVILDGWKLIWNYELRDDRPEFELFEHREDPLNLKNVADDHGTLVAELHGEIETWLERAEAERVSDGTLSEDLDPQELEQLRALGYVN
jgi:arylsulfatase A-like enzyme